MTQYEPVIGLEVHAQLLTKTKLFCGCSTAFGSKPNSNVCPVCLGLPGALPVANDEALRLAVRAGIALDLTINQTSIFARKQYFYPDLPKGYQISQYEEPYSSDGHLDVEVEGVKTRIGITRIHMEEDAGKSTHGVGGDSVVDLNRACTPLIEIVSEPDIRSSAEAAAYLRVLRDILVSIGVNDGNLEEGSFRCDANVSIRPVGQEKFGTRAELKNLNSFRFVQRAIDVEIARQTAILDAGGEVVQETRSFDPDTSKTRSLRAKADAHDYRYFPEPDLPPVVISDEMIEEQRAMIGELPRTRKARYMSEFGLSDQAASTLTGHPDQVAFFEGVISTEGTTKIDPKKVANWMLTELQRDIVTERQQIHFPVSPAQLAELIVLVDSDKISGKQAKEVYAGIVKTDTSPSSFVKEHGMEVVSDEGELLAICEEVVAKSEKQVAQYRAGKKGVVGFFVGQVMKATRGQANPKMVNQILTRLLEG